MTLLRINFARLLLKAARLLGDWAHYHIESAARARR